MAETTRVALSNIPSVLLAVMLLAALISCGPVPSEEGSRNRVSDSGTGPARGLSPAETVPHRGLKPVPQAWPASRASNMQSLPTARDQPTRMPEQLVLPESIAKELTSPDVSVRLRALDTLAQQGPKAPLDHLVVALDDEDEAVRDKALAIIEQQAAIEPEREEVSSEQ